MRTALHYPDFPFLPPDSCALPRDGAGGLPLGRFSLGEEPLSRQQRRRRQRPRHGDSGRGGRGMWRHAAWGGCRGDASPPRFKRRLGGAAALPLTEVKMAAAASDLLTGWCLFGLALLVRGGSPALRRPPHTSPPLPWAGCCSLFSHSLFQCWASRPLSSPVPLGLPRPRVLPCGCRGCLGHGAVGQSPHLAVGAALPLRPASRAVCVVACSVCERWWCCSSCS